MWKVFLEKKAVVIQKINNLAQTGQVRINDIEWDRPGHPMTA